jgi:hypothetical protein
MTVCLRLGVAQFGREVSFRAPKTLVNVRPSIGNRFRRSKGCHVEV